MASDQLKLAAYLDEAGDEPISACKTLAALKINYVVLRTIWSGNICDLNDQNCSSLRKLLADHNLSVVALASDLGNVDHIQLNSQPKSKVDRLFNLASYFQAGMVRIHCGTKNKTIDEAAVTTWTQQITDRCLSASLVPLYEIGDKSSYHEPVEVAKFLSSNRRWRLLYDPVQLIIKRNQDPFSRYWTLLRSSVAAVDARDFKIGYGYKPVGFGDAKMRLTIDDGLNGLYKGWYFLEPSLGRRFGSAVTKSDTFKLAFEAFESHQPDL